MFLRFTREEDDAASYDAGMGAFADITLARVPPGFHFFDALRLLFEWVEQQDYVVSGHDGDLYGSLCGHTGDTGCRQGMAVRTDRL